MPEASFLICTWCRQVADGDEKAVHMHVPRIVWQQHVDLVFHQKCYRLFQNTARLVPAGELAEELRPEVALSRPKLEEYTSTKSSTERMFLKLEDVAGDDLVVDLSDRRAS